MNQDDQSSDSNSAEKEVNQDGQSNNSNRRERVLIFIKMSHATVMHLSLAMYHHCTQRATLV